MTAKTPPRVSVRAVREAYGLSHRQLQARIAERGVTVTTTTLREAELGDTRPSDRLTAAWAMALGISPEDVSRSLGSPPTVPIRAVRKARGWTSKALANSIASQNVPVHDAHVRNVELGLKQPGDALLVAWAKALQISPVDVILPARDIQQAA